MHTRDARTFTATDLDLDAQKIEHDNRMVAKSVVFCGAATAIMTMIGLLIEVYVL
ncbi:hypothetical protein P5V93_23630 [Mycobacteroides abscessus subsp. abscessus]|uniref:hypothetical protein n=1 Tax=Mycobacteroides abscessus TaxID=36809 RepID=UPI0002F2965D|nr:hypothetical protein [Mycobacteroides abscessus]MDO3101113.1 hypothetical protein [Mycobacteroides abscessus subsp. abscessus]MDO3185076.1 hypothetical protein [Mycobacteroides abscessus subsp. abscessus]MDO3194300.1 hypothetical protein [Mycobacteroides abscessus subsp. abscessus]MDO3287505.1 hypothetical protein [Mycobacteroides abscessus subsp. abscessus]CPR67499.1 Uncharacterised protein [Mycobacteroides abscessus]